MVVVIIMMIIVMVVVDVDDKKKIKNNTTIIVNLVANKPLPRKGSSGFMGAPVKATTRRLGQFLSRVVLPRMEWGGEPGQRLLEWLIRAII